MVVSSDREERARVRGRIGSLILEFCTERLKQPEFEGTFFMEELRQFVETKVSTDLPRQRIAPDSPGRILRQLRQERQLNYKVLWRGQSLYQVLPIVERPAEQAELFAGAGIQKL